jgi:RecA-family ATPase
MDSTAKHSSHIASITKGKESKPQALASSKLSIVNARSIQQREYSEPIFIIEPLLHEGATLMASRPKLGKSWLGLQCAISVATGKPALGRFNVVRPGRVLYLALEETERRIHDRLEALLPCGMELPNLEFLFELPKKLMDGGEVYLSSHLKQHAGEYSLVIIDTLLAAFASSSRRDVVKLDYEKSELLRKLAQEHKIALLLIHHQNKATIKAR